MIKTLLIICLLPFMSFSQSVGIGTNNPNSSSALDISNNSKGLLIPRMTTTAVHAITNPAKGLMVYDSLLNQLMVNMGSTSNPDWQSVVAGSGWSLTGNSGTDPTQQFLGTNDNQPLRFRVNGLSAGELNPITSNVSLGQNSGANVSGIGNTAIGHTALSNNTSGSENTAVGASALGNNQDGNYNTAIGAAALAIGNSGSNNTAVGYTSMYLNRLGASNTAVGYRSLYHNGVGNLNVAVGEGALEQNTNGTENSALGEGAMGSNLTGLQNTAAGWHALYSNTTGSNNTALGDQSLYHNTGTLGSNNTAVGFGALAGTIQSQYNTAIGFTAGAGGFDLGYNNTILGANCGVNQDGLYNCIAIGQQVICDASSQARIGNAATNSIGGYADWTNISDGRFKRNIKEDVKGLDFIMKLRPVTYNLDVTGIQQHLQKGMKNIAVNASFKKEMAEKEQTKWSGFVAQEVEQAAKETDYEFSGVDKPQDPNGLYGLRYAEFVVPLIKAVQELNLKVDRLEKENAQLKSVSKPDDLMAIISKQQKLIEDLQNRFQALEEQNKSSDKPLAAIH